MSDTLAPNIAVIVEDKALNGKICNAIERYRFDVIRGYDPLSIERLVEFNQPHVAVISTVMTSANPLEIAKKIRIISEPYNLPIIFLLNNKDNYSDFTLNNDYLNNDELIRKMAINFTPNELMITIRDLLRKANPIFENKIISYSNLRLDLSINRVYKDGQEFILGPTEFQILKLLVQRPYYVFTRRQIIDYIWGVDNEIADRTIDVHINRIRKILKINKDNNPLIKTIRAAGYCLDIAN